MGNAKLFDHLTGKELNASLVKFEKWCIYDSKAHFFSPTKWHQHRILTFPFNADWKIPFVFSTVSATLVNDTSS